VANDILTSYGTEQDQIRTPEIMKRLRVFVRHPEHVPDVGFTPVCQCRERKYLALGRGLVKRWRYRLINARNKKTLANM